jgi:hypothetical protein
MRELYVPAAVIVNSKPLNLRAAANAAIAAFKPLFTDPPL